ncbi:hypothetical protein Ahy_B01g052922 isoform A [Arachis hypogaea]|uniref:Uncharacterized protein n=1 Tax=Arachis hypogaea TaxID=3818 RepID=A0A445AQN5_ARAHY|nr:hypothetical protein Ahy_B01g052922 isoform A [Arachis hypogaea]
MAVQNRSPSLPPSSPGPQRRRFFLFPVLKNPGSSARRLHLRWLLCSWLGVARRRVAACRRLAYRLVSPVAVRRRTLPKTHSPLSQPPAAAAAASTHDSTKTSLF